MNGPHQQPAPKTASDRTTAFYESHAQEYFDRTVSADLTPLYSRVLPYLSPGARLLDVGCGSGRDLRFFIEHGFDAIGVDASVSLTALASTYSGAKCMVLRFEDLTFQNRFEAVWACASLLHVARRLLPDVLHRLWNALIPRGVIFASFQLGAGETTLPDGRFVVYYQPREVISSFEKAGFSIIDSWVTEDLLEDRPSIRWINVLANR